MMTIEGYINEQLPERQEVLRAIHEVIVQEDKTVTAVVGEMMGKPMILYNEGPTFKYGLASVKTHMSLHALPMYMTPVLYDRFRELLPDAAFQKGCVNFKHAGELPLPAVRKMIADCAKVSIAAILAERNNKKAKKK